MFNNDFKQALLNQIARIVAGPALLVVLPLYLSPEAQGYWFSIMGLAALSLFADLGFSTLILQFVAHEFAHLTFDEQKRFTGLEAQLRKIASLFIFALKWGAIAAITVFPVIAWVGYRVLDKGVTSLEWKTPWFLYCLASVPVFLNSIALACFEGCNSVGVIQKIRYQSALISTCVLILGLVGGIGLYSLALASLFSSAYSFVRLGQVYGGTLRQIWALRAGGHYRWGSEIFPLLWKYAVSWVSGYFIFQIFTPLAFHEYGPVEAGKVGLSIAIWMAIFGIANTWMVVITPKLNMLMSERRYEELNVLFGRNLKMAMLTYFVAALFFFGITGVFQNELGFLIGRIAAPISLAILALTWFMQIPINAFALYMRAQKTEPLMYMSLFGGFYVALATVLVARNFPYDFYFSGFLSGQLWGLPAVYLIYRKYRKT